MVYLFLRKIRRANNASNPYIDSDSIFKPQCQPLLSLMSRWKASKQKGPKVPALTRAQFEQLTPEEHDVLLQSLYVVRDEKVLQ